MPYLSNKVTKLNKGFSSRPQHFFSSSRKARATLILLCFLSFNLLSTCSYVFAQMGPAGAGVPADARLVFGNSQLNNINTTPQSTARNGATPTRPKRQVVSTQNQNQALNNLPPDAQSVFNNPQLNTITGTDTSSLAQQAAEQDAANFSYLQSILNFFGLSSNNNEVSQGIEYFYDNTIVKWLQNIGALIAKYLKEFVVFILTPIIKVMIATLVQFAYNPDVSVGQDEFSKSVRTLFRLVQDLANDLLLLFFILSIWRYWTNATFGNGGLMGAIGRLIVAVGTIIAWPTIYHYVILISNSAIDLFLKKITQDPTAVANIVAEAISNAMSFQGTISFFNSSMNGGASIQALLGTIPVAFFEITLVSIIGIAIVASFVVFFAMKIIQFIMIVAAFVFAPFFLLFLVSPDTDRHASSFITTFVETTLWTFIWSGFLLLLIALLQSNVNTIDVIGHLSSVPTATTSAGGTASSNPQNPWFVLFLILGILQGMIQVPEYLSRAKISEASSFLELYALTKMARGLGVAAFGPAGAFSKLFRAAKRGLGGDSASANIGGAGSLPTGGNGAVLGGFNRQMGQQLASLNGVPVRAGGMTMPGAGGQGLLATAAALAGNATSRATAGAGGGPALLPTAGSPAMAQFSAAAAGNPAMAQFATASADATMGNAGAVQSILTGAAGGSAQPGLLAQMTRNALGQFSSSLSGGGGVGSAAYNSIADQSDAVPTLTRQAVAWKENPWHGLHGRAPSVPYVSSEFTFKKIRPGSVDLAENKKDPNQNRIDFDDSGNIQKVLHRKDASAPEIGMLSTVAALASLNKDGRGHDDPRAVSATNNAVKNANRWDAPLPRKFALWLSRGNAPEYHRNLEKDRLEKEKAQARISGSLAYVQGKSGNAYTKFLEWKFGGKFSEADKDYISYAANNPESIMGGFNAGTDTAFRTLNQGGLDISDVTWGIASHPAIINMKPGQKTQAIPAVAHLVNTQLAEMGFGPRTADDPRVANLKFAATDAIMTNIGNSHVRAAVAISDIAGVNSVTPRMLNQVLQVHWNRGLSQQPQGYEKAVNIVLGRQVEKS